MKSPSEVWLTIPDTAYAVSNMGRVRSPRGLILRPRRHSNGYQRVSLGKVRDQYIHRLVCLAFIGPPPSGNHVDHINYKRDDNRVENLRWITPEENRARRLVRIGEKHGNAKLSEQFVRELRGGLHIGTDREIAHRFGVSRDTVRDARNGKLWRHVQ